MRFPFPPSLPPGSWGQWLWEIFWQIYDPPSRPSRIGISGLEITVEPSGPPWLVRVTNGQESVFFARCRARAYAEDLVMALKLADECPVFAGDGIRRAQSSPMRPMAGVELVVERSDGPPPQGAVVLLRETTRTTIAIYRGWPPLATRLRSSLACAEEIRLP